MASCLKVFFERTDDAAPCSKSLTCGQRWEGAVEQMTDARDEISAWDVSLGSALDD